MRLTASLSLRSSQFGRTIFRSSRNHHYGEITSKVKATWTSYSHCNPVVAGLSVSVAFVFPPRNIFNTGGSRKTISNVRYCNFTALLLVPSTHPSTYTPPPTPASPWASPMAVFYRSLCGSTTPSRPTHRNSTHFSPPQSREEARALPLPVDLCRIGLAKLRPPPFSLDGPKSPFLCTSSRAC